MRTTLDLSDDLFRRAKKRAADEAIPLRDVVEAALHEWLSGRPRESTYRFEWTPEHGKLLPGIDLDDRDSRIDRMVADDVVHETRIRYSGPRGTGPRAARGGTKK
jgi:hypothetical protein